MRRILLSATALAFALSAPALAQETSAPVPAAASTAPVGKLSDAVRPSAYRLDLTIDPNLERFSGRVEIDAVLKAASDTIWIHGRDLKVSKAVATVGDKQYRGNWEQVEDTGVVKLTFAEPLPAGPFTLSFAYDAPFGQGPAGMFRVKVGGDWYSWTQFESIDARAAFPGFDEPSFKTPFTVTLRTPKGLVAVSNAPEIGKTEEGGYDVHRFAPTLPLPTYLVAMMAGPFAVAEGTVPPTPWRKTPLPLRVISPKPNADRLGFALENSKTIVARLEDYFGQAFPYPKLDQITSPIMPGAMENAGADLYNDNIIVMTDASPISQKRTFGMVVSHELAHQWFGDLVTPAWWDDIWLNESFANWMGYRIGGEWRPDLKIGSGATEEGFAAMNTDALVAGRPIHQPIITNNQIDAAFDTITYGKGGHVVAMIAGFMGDAKFKAGVRRYMAAHKYGNATSAEFFKAMAEVSGDPRILPAMQSFTDQQGVPLLTFSRTKGGWTVAQSRYARLGTTPPPTKWGVPMCVRTGAARTCSLLDSATATFAAKRKGVFMPNAGGTGYYRFELPKADWDALIARADRLSGNEALALSDSLRASFYAGRASIAQLVALARKLAVNPDSYANGSALDSLQAISSAGLLDDDADKAYRALVGKIYAPRFAASGLDLKVGAYTKEDPELRQKRIALVGALASVARDPALQNRFAAAADAFLGGDKTGLDQTWFGTAFTVWLDRNGIEGAKKLLDRALTTEDPALRPILLGVIAGSGKPEIGKWVLDDLKDPRLRTSERLNLIRGVIATAGTRDTGYDWMKANLDQLLGGAGGIFLAARLPATLNGFCSAERADEFAKDLRPRFAGKTAELELERTIERVRSCGTLKAARKDEVSRDIKAVN